MFQEKFLSNSKNWKRRNWFVWWNFRSCEKFRSFEKLILTEILTATQISIILANLILTKISIVWKIDFEKIWFWIYFLITLFWNLVYVNFTYEFLIWVYLIVNKNFCSVYRIEMFVTILSWTMHDMMIRRIICYWIMMLS